ncbi:MAG TPA: M48 family metalloprotease [Phycisphaerales bacterium]|nr:M48 family metalloprotease [Phycisphaerales bacterium]
MTVFKNNFKTVVLLGLLMGLFLFVGGQFGRTGLLIGLIFGAATNLIAWFFSDKIALSSMRAIEVHADSPGAAARLWHMVDELRRNADLPMPRVYVCPAESPNAFATGRSPKKAAVAVTEGALRLLSEQELRGVMAHELAHVKNRDTLTSCVAAMIAGVLSYFAQWGLMFGGMGRDREGGNPIFGLVAILLAPIAAALIKAMISRSREYVADHHGARIAGTPDGLISALQKLESYSKRIPLPVHNPAMNNMFIVEPFLGRSILNMFASHPPTEKRVAALRQIRAE